MVREAQAEVNRLDRLFSKFSIEHKAVTIASIAVMAAVISLFISLIAVNSAKTADIRSQMQDEKLQGLEGDIDVYRIRAAKMNAWLAANGVPIEDIYND